MEELIARIRTEGWYMVLDYMPTPDVFVCELSSRQRLVFALSKVMESAVIDAIHKMDE